jgi:hypothetical protein
MTAIRRSSANFISFWSTHCLPCTPLAVAAAPTIGMSARLHPQSLKDLEDEYFHSFKPI